jgi:hypothetical protein
MRIAPIVERLKKAGLERVYGALELAGLQAQPGRLPQRFVIPEGWSAGGNSLVGAHDQNQTETFLVVSLLEGTARNEKQVSDDLHEEERAILEVLVGWIHPDCSRACEAVSGRLLSVNGTTLSWAVAFRTGRHIRKAS